MTESDQRGERIQIECPDCDNWVILLPAQQFVHRALHALDVAYPGATDAITSVKVFTNACEGCGAQITLTATRGGATAPQAEA